MQEDQVLSFLSCFETVENKEVEEIDMTEPEKKADLNQVNEILESVIGVHVKNEVKPLVDEVKNSQASHEARIKCMEDRQATFSDNQKKENDRFQGEITDKLAKSEESAVQLSTKVDSNAEKIAGVGGRVEVIEGKIAKVKESLGD